NIIVTGVGGTGIVTIGALVGMAAHIEGHGCSVLDMTGLAQKYGAVVSHLRVAKEQEDIHAVRIPAGEAHTVIGGDLIVASSFDTLAKTDPKLTRAVINNHTSMPASFTKVPDLEFPRKRMESMVRDATLADQAVFIDSTQYATTLLGDSVFSNLFLLGYAYQSGYLPVGEEALFEAVRLNGVAVEKNISAFKWGRLACHDRARFEKVLAQANPTAENHLNDDLDSLIGAGASMLGNYQDDRLAQDYRSRVQAFVDFEKTLDVETDQLSRSVALGLRQVLAYKDEYEVARLYSQPEFWDKLDAQFEGDYAVHFHLAPPLLAKRDTHSGLPLKREYGAWLRPIFGLLAKFKRLRGTALDPFGWTEDRKLERAVIQEQQSTLDLLLQRTSPDNYDLAVAVADLMLQIRGYGHIKARNVERVRREQNELLESMVSANDRQQAA
ncbi:MAG: DUF6537 domain-containing protein, partial [Pseudomonadota bacterium]